MPTMRRNVTVGDLLDRVTDETLVLLHRDVTSVDDIFTDDLAGAIFDKLAERVGEEEAARRLDLLI